MGYKNTFYHKEPKLDITEVESFSLDNKLDFVISSDVLEHVKPPRSIAFENIFKMLKPNGFLLLTVPYINEGRIKEHFPDLFKYHIIKKEGENILVNETKDGKRQTFKNLVYHGGEGATLEMRVFSKSSLLYNLEAVGFKNIKIINGPYLKYGIYYKLPWSLPIVARKIKE